MAVFDFSARMSSEDCGPVGSVTVRTSCHCRLRSSPNATAGAESRDDHVAQMRTRRCEQALFLVLDQAAVASRFLREFHHRLSAALKRRLLDEPFHDGPREEMPRAFQQTIAAHFPGVRSGMRLRTGHGTPRFAKRGFLRTSDDESARALVQTPTAREPRRFTKLDARSQFSRQHHFNSE